MALLEFLRPQVHTYASASLASSDLSSPLRSPTALGGWQRQAWDFYDTVPEMRLVVQYRAAALSKVKLGIGLSTPDGIEPVDTPESKQILDTLFGGLPHHANSLSRIAQQLTIVGETYIVTMPNESGVDDWFIIPPDHVDFTAAGRKSGRISITHPLTGVRVALPVDAAGKALSFNMRIWDPHPHAFWEADSPTRGAIDTLQKIYHLDAAILSMAKSRLTGRGIYAIPSEADLPAPTTGVAGETKESQFRKDLYEAASTAIQNPHSAAASLPILLHMPAEAIKVMKDKPIDFFTDFDEQVKELLDREITRYASGQPLPTEKITGISAANHWNAWILSEEDIKFDIAPLAQLICDALTLRVVRPLVGNVNWVLVPDFSELVSRPDKTPEAIQLANARIITRTEARVDAGYSPTINDKDPEADLLANVDAPDVGPPVSVDAGGRGDPPEFAVANLLARDLIYTAGQWMMSHSGRENRQRISEVDPLKRHEVFTVGEDALAEAVARARVKFGDVVSPHVFDTVVSHVRELLSARSAFSPARLVGQ